MITTTTPSGKPGEGHVHASLGEVAAAVAVMTGEPHLLMTGT